MIGRQIGLIIGPAFNLIALNWSYEIGPFLLDNLSAPGVIIIIHKQINHSNNNNNYNYNIIKFKLSAIDVGCVASAANIYRIILQKFTRIQ